MRGISRLSSRDSWRQGIIPAGAGHLECARLLGVVVGDHPRRCGAFSTISAGITGAWGSSPQVRGISQVVQGSRFSGRIIPAGAGHFLTAWCEKRQVGDHPRRCGAFEGLR